MKSSSARHHAGPAVGRASSAATRPLTARSGTPLRRPASSAGLPVRRAWRIRRTCSCMTASTRPKRPAFGLADAATRAASPSMWRTPQSSPRPVGSSTTRSSRSTLTRTGRLGRAQPALLPPPLQEGHGPHAEGLRGGSSLGPTAQEAGDGGDGHRSVPRGGLRVERALLRGFGRRARHESDPLSFRRNRRGPDLRCRPVLARRHSCRLERQGRRRDPAG